MLSYRHPNERDAISEHRAMWNWISEQCIVQKRIVSKDDYFNELNVPYPDRPPYQEPLCGYCMNDSGDKSYLMCWKCPLDFPRLDAKEYKPPKDQKSKTSDKEKIHGDTGMCWFSDNPYFVWRNAIILNPDADYIFASSIANQIANIPEYGFKKIMPWD